MYVYALVLSRLVVYRLVLSRLVFSCLVLRDSGRMFRVLLSVLCCVLCVSLCVVVCLFGSVSLIGCVVGLFVWVCLGLCVLGGGEGVYTSNAFPCVRSKRFRVYRHQAHMFHTCGLGAGTHADVLNVHTGFFLRFFTVPQHTNTNTHTPNTHHDHNDTTTTTTPRPHNTSRRQKQREKEKTRQDKKARQEKREDEREERI